MQGNGHNTPRTKGEETVDASAVGVLVETVGGPWELLRSFLADIIDAKSLQDVRTAAMVMAIQLDGVTVER